MEAQVLTLHRR